MGKSKPALTVKKQIFELLLIGCEKTFNRAIADGELLAHEAQSNYRFRILRDCLLNIEKNIAFLSSNSQLDIKEIHKFIEKYLLVVGKRSEIIKSTSYTGKSAVSINDIYVYQNLIKKNHVLSSLFSEYICNLKYNEIQTYFDQTLHNKNKNKAFKIKLDNLKIPPDYIETKLVSDYYTNHFLPSDINNSVKISLDDFLLRNFRSVVLGDPGAGKTTFIKKICYDLCTKNSEKKCVYRQLIPFVVVLREYQERNFNQNISIIEFIRQESNSNYQISVPNDAFEYLFLNGYIFLIFDRLDELLNTGFREKIVEEIESFCSLYPFVPVLVTSRKVGYNDAPLRDDMFQIFELAPFAEEQVKEYVNKWFALDSELSSKDKKNKPISFLRESQIVQIFVLIP